MLVVLVLVYISIFTILLIISIIYKINYDIKSKVFERKVIMYFVKEKKMYTMDHNEIEFDKHLKFLSKEFRKNKQNLLAYEVAVDRLISSEKDIDFKNLLTEELNYVITVVKNKSITIKTYFAHLLAVIPIDGAKLTYTVKGFLLSLIDSKSVYARENAIKAVIKHGDIEDITSVINLLNKNESLIHLRLLTEHLLAFDKNRIELIKALLYRYEEYTDEIKIAIINFARLANLPIQAKLYQALCANENREVYYALIKYFGQVEYDHAKVELLRVGNREIKKGDDGDYGLVSVISKTMKKYKSDEAVEFLKRSITSKDWFARSNSAITLIGYFGNDALALVDNLNDKYASEMIRYQLSTATLKAESDGDKYGNI